MSKSNINSKSAGKSNKQSSSNKKNKVNNPSNSKTVNEVSKKESVKTTDNDNRKIAYIIVGIVIIVAIIMIVVLLIGGKAKDEPSSNSNQNSNSSENSNHNDSTHITLGGYTIDKVDGYDMAKASGMEEILEIYKEGNEGEYKLFKVSIESKAYSELKDNTDSLKSELEKKLEEKVWDIQYKTYHDIEYMVISTGDQDKTYYQMVAYAKLSDKETFYITGQSLKTTENDERYVEDYDLFSEIAPILSTAKKVN